MAHKWRELQAMTDDELIDAFDALTPNVSVGIQWYRAELAHREIRRATDASLRQTEEVRLLTAKIERLTRFIVWLTVAAVAATIAGVIW